MMQIPDEIEQSIQLAGGVVSMITAIANAADVPDEVRISREATRRARQISTLARKLAASLSRIDGPIDTRRERMAAARAAGFKAELQALGVSVP